MANLGTIATGTLIGFSANKTAEAAAKDTATNRVDICETKELYLNGERIALKDNEQTLLAGVTDTGSLDDKTVKVYGKSPFSEEYVTTPLYYYVYTWIQKMMTSALTYKGTVETLADIHGSHSVGEVYNVTKEFTITTSDTSGPKTETYPAGTNIAIKQGFTKGSGIPEAEWADYFDPLGGVVCDLSDYVHSANFTALASRVSALETKVAQLQNLLKLA